MRILIFGSGVMATGIARLLAEGHDVTVLSQHLDQSQERFDVVRTLDDVPPHPYSAVISCVVDDERSREIWLHPSVEALLRRHLPAVVELSTLSVAWIEEWHRRMDALGVVAVESPVTGSRSGADSGTLSAFRFSRSPSRLVDEIFGVFTRRVYEFSAPANPTRFKLIYNSWGASVLATLGPHAALLHDHLAEDLVVASRIVRSDGWMAAVVNAKWDRYRDDDFGDADFRLAHMVKDLDYLSEIVPDDDTYIRKIRDAYAAVLSPSTKDLDFSAISRPVAGTPQPTTPCGTG
ncbi:MAG: NAD(P)-binding domain-containing protein [Microbacterium sp.]